MHGDALTAILIVIETISPIPKIYSRALPPGAYASNLSSMPKAIKCTVFKFTLSDKPGILLSLANRLRAADISLLSFWARSNKDNTSTMRCIAERDSQFRDFSKSAELGAEEEVAIHVTANERGGDFIRVLEKVAGVNVNIEAIEAVSLAGQTGWVLWTNQGQVDSLLAQLNT